MMVDTEMTTDSRRDGRVRFDSKDMMIERGEIWLLNFRVKAPNQLIEKVYHVHHITVLLIEVMP